MIEKEITIPKEIIVKGLLHSRSFSEFIDNLKGFLYMSCYAASAIILVDSITSNTQLIKWHILSLVTLSLLVAVVTHAQWKKEIINKSKDFTYNAKLDDTGVFLSGVSKHYNWNQYQYYIEYSDYLLIKGTESGVSFLPKTKELSDVIEFTKTKIPNKKINKDNLLSGQKAPTE